MLLETYITADLPQSPSEETRVPHVAPLTPKTRTLHPRIPKGDRSPPVCGYHRDWSYQSRTPSTRLHVEFGKSSLHGSTVVTTSGPSSHTYEKSVLYFL